jgi:hypothetical protein
MCLCFPIIRPLWRRYVKGLSKGDSSGPFSSMDRGYELSGRTNTNHGKSGMNTFTVSAGTGVLKHSKKTDNNSTDSILGDDFRVGGGVHGGIKETKSVVIEYDDQENVTERSQSGRSI